MTKLLIWLLIIFLVLRMLRNSFKVVVFKQDGFQQNPFNREEAAPRKPEGSVTIEQKSSGRTSSDDGEYVDYEEVK
jgi:hypothetical protein